MIDGVALEERCRYSRLFKSIIGLCREHAGALDLRIQTTQSILAIDEAIHAKNPRAHYASEATVVAIAPFQSSNYSAIPFALSGSCKAETGEGMAKWVAGMVRAWKSNPDGEATHGPIWSIATDGKSTMRVCRFILCIVEQTRGQRQTGRNDLPGRMRELLMDGESREQEVFYHIHTPYVVYIQTWE